jgi:hypothetical protein
MKVPDHMKRLAEEAGLSSDTLFSDGNGCYTVIYILLYRLIDYKLALDCYRKMKLTKEQNEVQ